jgi:thymidylate synthase (FAD)
LKVKKHRYTSKIIKAYVVIGFKGEPAMNVKLIGFTPNSEKIPAMAAKLTHSTSKPEDLDKTSTKELKAILEHVMKLGHTSVIEHTSFTFAISDVKLVCSITLV